MKVRKWLSVGLVFLLLFSLTACGANSGTEAMDNAVAEQEMPREESGSLTGGSGMGTEQSTALPENRKLIKTVNIDAETEDLDALLDSLNEKITQLGGYVQDRYFRNGSAYAQSRRRSAELTVRIPAEQVDGFVEHVGGVSNIVSSNETVEDVTLEYVDTESRVKALEMEQERLLALLEQAQSLDDILEIESRLTDVRYELESVASRLRTYDNLVSYATVYLSVSEVQEYTPVAEETVWQRISGGFMDSLEGITDGAVDLLVWVLANSPYLVIYGAIAAVVILLLRRGRKAKVKKTENPGKTE